MFTDVYLAKLKSEEQSKVKYCIDDVIFYNLWLEAVDYCANRSFK